MNEQTYRCGREPEAAGAWGWRALNEGYRKGGPSRGGHQTGRDLVTEMSVAQKRPDVLASQLRNMGVSEDGDEVLDE